jgi:hypothetical protein
MRTYLEKNSGTISFVLLSTSLFIGFIFNEDSSGSGGHIADFNNTWKYVEVLTQNFFAFPSQHGTDNTPLGYMILSWFNYFAQDKYIVRVIYCTLSISLPILFYYALKNHYESIDSNILLLFASLTFLFPSFRSGAIWANNSIVANIFFIIFVIFLNKWIKKGQFKNIDLNIFLQLVFLALAVYCRQYYAVVYLYAMYIYFKKLDIKFFLTISLIVLVFTLPGFWIIINDTVVLRTVFSPKIYNTILISPSIMSFYLIPIFLILSLSKINNINFRDKSTILSTIFFIILITFITLIFDYNYKIGGGYFIKLSYLLFDNLLLGSLTSIVGLILLFNIAKENNDNLILVIILIFAFPGFYVFQKYFEPMFFFMIFLMFKSRIPELFLKVKKNIYFLYLYFGVYLTSAIINDIFRITKTL